MAYIFRNNHLCFFNVVLTEIRTSGQYLLLVPVFTLSTKLHIGIDINCDQQFLPNSIWPASYLMLLTDVYLIILNCSAKK